MNITVENFKSENLTAKIVFKITDEKFLKKNIMPKTCTCGGFEFKFGEKSINFDWDTMGTDYIRDLDSDNILMEARMRHFCADDFACMWLANGITELQVVQALSGLDIEGIGKLTAIEEVYYDCDDNNLQPLHLDLDSFELIYQISGDLSLVYEVPVELLMSFNDLQRTMNVKEEELTGLEGKGPKTDKEEN